MAPCAGAHNMKTIVMMPVVASCVSGIEQAVIFVAKRLIDNRPIDFRLLKTV